jgi:Pyruvate/2-oxoacid:ferredoxin oxidoreductase delta subunit
MDSEVLQSDKSIQTEKRNAENNETNEEKVKISRKCFNIKCLLCYIYCLRKSEI